jgi:diguanylate cyclase (GGDEF)-like protein/PAS domain S-box-containing protein
MFNPTRMYFASQDKQGGSGRASGETAEHPAPRLLVTDDDERLRASTVALLESRGYVCEQAANGREALDRLLRGDIDLLLLDLMMPHMDGYQLLEIIQRRRIDCDVIVISGEATFDNATRVFRGGAIDFINKPFEPQTLFHRVEHSVHQRRLRQELETARRELEASEQRYRFIVSHSPDIIYMIDGEGRFRFINERVTELLGFQPEELIGQHYSALVHEDDLDLAAEVFELQSGQTGDNRQVELRFKCRHRSDYARSFESKSIVIELSATPLQGPVEEDATPLGTYGVARDISDRKKAQEMIQFQAYHDLLTRLPNRELFMDRLQLAISQANRGGHQLAVLFLDMDGFKFINDSLGHMTGDKLLQQVGRRLSRTLRDSDTVSRIGGDEFNILLPDLQNPEEAGLIAQKILDAFSRPIQLDNHEITIGFSIGISLYPGDAGCAEDLIKNADMAMYHIKGRGKNGYEYFSDNMQQIYQFRHSLEQDIRKALELGQFEPWYQPQYAIDSGEIVGLEALIRWNHPERGLITPDLFIPIAEEIGLINEIGRFMLEAGCSQLREWIDMGSQPVKLSINVSPFQLIESNFDRVLCDLAESRDLPHDRLVMEITETALMQDMEQVLPRLKKLIQCGIGIAIDDFGVGYSSLAYLQSLPARSLKIDRSFLSGSREEMDKTSIIKAIVAMAREMGLEVVMEGVETTEQLSYLREIGGIIGQGYLLGYPQPADKILNLIRP